MRSTDNYHEGLVKEMQAFSKKCKKRFEQLGLSKKEQRIVVLLNSYLEAIGMIHEGSQTDKNYQIEDEEDFEEFIEELRNIL